MRLPFISRHRVQKANGAAGFTLVELLVVIPIALLTIAALISLMVALIGDVLMARTRSVAIYELQNTLDRIEADTRATSTFLQSYSLLTSPQGRDGGTAPFDAASPNFDLILSQNATTGSPTDGTRNIVYYADQPNPCTGNYQLNRPLTVRIIYFTTNNPDGTKTLWRRVIVPSWTTTAGQPNSVCAAPWQRDNCPEGSTISASGPCQARDERMLSSVNSFVPTYYDSSGNVTTDVRAANSVTVAIGQAKKIAGETITTSSSARTSRSNTTTDQAPTAAPSISILNPTLNVDNHPLLASFTWNDIPNASYYSIRYRRNAGAWIYPPDQTNTVFRMNTARPSDVINIEVTAKNDLGASPIGTYTYNKPIWTDCNLLNGWVPYGGLFTTPGFTLTSAGVVVVRGLVKNGPSGNGMYPNPICNLPTGLRPSSHLVIPAAMNGGTNSVGSRINVNTDGNVHAVYNLNSVWFSMDAVMFLPSGTSWTNMTPTNSWTNNGGGYQPLAVTKDSVGRVHLAGVVGPGTTADNTVIGTLPAGYAPSEYLHFSAVGQVNPNNSSMVGVGVSPGLNAAVAKSIPPTTYEGFYQLYYPSTFSGWQNLTLVNGWSVYPGFSAPQYAKASDGIVIVKGLVRNTNIGAATQCTVSQVIATLPAGYRPRQQTIIDVLTYGGAGRFDILPNGDILCINGVGGWNGLESIHFLAEQ